MTGVMGERTDMLEYSSASQRCIINDLSPTSLKKLLAAELREDV